MTFKPGALAIVVAATSLLVVACGGGGGNAKSFCNALANGADPVGLFGAYDPGTDAKPQLDAAMTRLQELKKSAPSNVQAALDDLVAVATDLEATLAARASDNPGAPPATMPLSDTEKATKASAVIGQVMATTCASSSGSGAPASGG